MSIKKIPTKNEIIYAPLSPRYSNSKKFNINNKPKENTRMYNKFELKNELSNPLIIEIKNRTKK
jgi:hypothetical protein